jgi:hypothetical protein
MEDRREPTDLGEGVNLFVDVENRPILVVAGEVDRFEMADRVYLTVAPILGVDELEGRLDLEAGQTGGKLIHLAMRVEWCAMRQGQDSAIIGPLGSGVPVTICNLDGLIRAEELVGS